MTQPLPTILPIHRTEAAILIFRACGNNWMDDEDYQKTISTLAEHLAKGRCVGLLRRGKVVSAFWK